MGCVPSLTEHNIEVSMPYSVFISHSTKDRGLVISLANLLQKFGVQTHVAEWYLTPGEPLAKKVSALIESADCVVVLLTREGARSSWVQQEIGVAVGRKKVVVPVVEKGTDQRNLGALQGIEYIEYDPHQPEQALDRLASHVNRLKLNQDGEEQKEKARLVLAGLMAFLLLLSGARDDDLL
jgi:hypothetical protein